METWRCNLLGHRRGQRRDSNRGGENRVSPTTQRSDHLANVAEPQGVQIIDDPAACFRGCLRQGPVAGGQAGGEGKKRRVQAGAARACRQKETPKGRSKALFARLAPPATPAALVDHLDPPSARNACVRTDQRPQIPDAPSRPCDGASVSHGVASAVVVTIREPIASPLVLALLC